MKQSISKSKWMAVVGTINSESIFGKFAGEPILVIAVRSLKKIIFWEVRGKQLKIFKNDVKNLP